MLCAGQTHQIVVMAHLLTPDSSLTQAGRGRHLFSARAPCLFSCAAGKGWGKRFFDTFA